MTIIAVLSVISACSLIGIGTITDTIEEMGVKVDRPASWKTTKLQHDEKYVDYVIDIPQKNSLPSNVVGHVALTLSKAIGSEKISIQSEVAGLTKLISKTVTELKTLEEKDVTFLGIPGKRAILEFRNSEDKSIAEKVAVTLTVKDNQTYAILLDEDAADFDMQLPVYDKIAGSVRFK